MGPREMLDRAEVENKWNLTPMKNFQLPRLTQRMWRTALVVLITSIIYEYVFEGRNPCFALIGAVYGVGSQFEEGFQSGINRFIGTLVGGFLVIPFYSLYTSQPFGIPDWVWLVAGLGLVQPGTVVYFVVMFTVGKERVVPYTIARILDTGVGVLMALLLTILLPTKSDREKGLSPVTFWSEIKEAFHSYRNKNQDIRKKEEENFGTVKKRWKKKKDN